MKKVKKTSWWYIVLDFAVRMIERFEVKEEQGWMGFEDVNESEYQLRIIKNAMKGDYVDAANLCLLAERVKGNE